MPPSPEGTLTVGLSANVLRARSGKTEFDGIGVYTASLERALAEAGVVTRRVFWPIGITTRARRATDLAFTVSLPAAVAARELTGVRLGTHAVERAVDVYHATDLLVPPLRRVPVVATVYDAIGHRSPEWARRRLRGLKNWVRSRGVLRAQAVIALSEAAVAEIMEHLGVPPARIRVIPPGLESSWFVAGSADTDDLLVPAALRAGYVLFVGTLQPRKNVRRLLAAYDRLPQSIRMDRQLVIVGRYGWGDPELPRVLQRREAAGRTRWLRYVDAPTLRALYAGAGVLAFPSLAEGFGLPVLEALATGLPVVASDLPVMREVAREWAVYVDPLDIEAISAGIVAALAGADAATVAARRRHAATFTLVRMGQATSGLYQELLGSS